MNKKSCFLVFLLTILTLTSACANSWFKAKITSPLNEYSLALSSVPGLPLKIKFDIDGSMPSISSITFFTDKGSFVVLDQTKVITLGKKATLSGNHIYWSPFEDNNAAVRSAKITAKIKYLDSVVTVEKSISATITKDENGIYTIK